MASITICDGCGGQGNNFERIGHVIRRDYCGGCQARAEEYQREVDALHSKIAADWNEKLAAIRGVYAMALYALPDYTP